MELSATRLISRPAREVFTFLADASNNPRWQTGMVTCRWASEGPIEVGSTYVQEARFMGRPVRSAFVVTDLDPDHRIRMTTTESTFPITVERRVTPVSENSCQVSAAISGGPSVPRLLRPVVQRLAQRSVSADYDRLVRLLEDDG